MKLKQLAAILGVAGSMVASGYAMAATYWTEYAYYTDATYTVWSGERIITCQGKVYTYGTVTIHRQLVERYNCAYPIP